MNSIDLLKKQHGEVNSLFQRMEKGGDPETFQHLFSQVYQALTAHTIIEEEYFYPALRNNADTARLVKDYHHEHGQVKQMLSQIASLDNASQEWSDRMTALMKAVQKHVAEEENDLFPKVSKLWDDQKLNENGQHLEAAFSKLKEGMTEPGNMVGMMGVENAVDQSQQATS
ncbi:MAG TPA: hemerythrin domain-containing protein [Chloroflexia bacterium]|nr:hemerythrin domain-containing protein [Chloroflexia bacterium]